VEKAERELDWPDIQGLILLPQTAAERKAFIERFENSEEHAKVHRIAEEFNRNYLVFHGNCKELLNEIDRIEAMPEIRQIVSGSTEGFDKRYEVAVEVTRLLANYVSSVMTLIKSTSRLVKKEINNKQFTTNYYEQIEKRFNKQEKWFIEGIRTVTQHRALPLVEPVLHSQQMSNGMVRVSLVPEIIVDQLLEGKWDVEQKEQIRKWARDGRMPFRDIVARYCNSQRGLTLWMYSSFVKIHDKQIQEMNNFVLGMGQSLPE
jgi:hypothetical protein